MREGEWVVVGERKRSEREFIEPRFVYLTTLRIWEVG